MVKVWIVVGLAVVILTVYSLVDCATTAHNRVRGLPRWVWMFVIFLVPVVGPLLWLIVGRGRRGAGIARSMAPDDDLDFLKGLDRQKTDEERIRALEQELADLDKPDPRTGSTGATGSTGSAGSTGPAGSTGSAGKSGFDPKPADPGEGELPGRRDA
ncbi:PLDc N-terminal domain-containing protein [Cryobacterium fucosi]|uniref:Cardiolipin synthase N-terminal domain-containing protein n=1 Tax=Cryobacterium fucosi TaxID=1259157 RepID=A0A4R9B3E1_9MICO|nr:PLDc N-terminal domain-containing protein [Cryobacterium fucosi]TFD75013.1 hypothetical protein E3T48_11965 [Cryobacterium fucosi]